MKNKTRHIDYTPWPTELTKQERINRQIEKAKRIDCPAGWTAIITSTKIEKLVSYGFRFEKIDLAKIGRVITNHDGSHSTIEAVSSATR
jgi:hypothetical protein